MPVKFIGAKPVPAIPLNTELEKEILPNVEMVVDAIDEILKG